MKYVLRPLRNYHCGIRASRAAEVGSLGASRQGQNQMDGRADISDSFKKGHKETRNLMVLQYLLWLGRDCFVERCGSTKISAACIRV